MTTRTLSIGLVVLAASGLCCKARASSSTKTPSATSAASQTTPGTDKPLAEMDGQPILASEVDGRVRPKLLELEQEVYQTRRDALDQIVSEKLIEREAKSRGLTKEAFLRSEVEAKVQPATEAEIQSLYDQNKARMGGRSLGEMKPQIVAFLRSQQLQARGAELRRDLMKKNKVVYLLDAPRFDVKPPDSAPAKGPETAPVTVVEFSDYQCPYCQRAEATVDGLMKKYGDQLRLVLIDYPIEGHPGAFPAARAAHCAMEQGKYWEYHQNLLRQPGDYSEKDFTDRAATLGLKADAFGTCLTSGKHDATIKAGLEQAAALGVTATPTFFINGRMVSGAREPDVFESIIDEELARTSK